MANLVTGVIALALAAAFLGVLLVKLPSVPLLIVIGIGFACMVASVVEDLRKQGF